MPNQYDDLSPRPENWSDGLKAWLGDRFPVWAIILVIILFVVAALLQHLIVPGVPMN